MFLAGPTGKELMDATNENCPQWKKQSCLISLN